MDGWIKQRVESFGKNRTLSLQNPLGNPWSQYPFNPGYSRVKYILWAVQGHQPHWHPWTAPEGSQVRWAKAVLLVQASPEKNLRRSQWESQVFLLSCLYMFVSFPGFPTNGIMIWVVGCWMCDDSYLFFLKNGIRNTFIEICLNVHDVLRVPIWYIVILAMCTWLCSIYLL